MSIQDFLGLNVFGYLLHLSGAVASATKSMLALPLLGSVFSLLAKSWVYIKCFFVFILIILVRVTMPKFKMESLSKLGWLYSLIFIFLTLCVYWLGFYCL